jgi:hypothetical protein
MKQIASSASTLRLAVRRFATIRDAKEFLVGRIVTEAQREGVSLSETERKMLYFSETAWTLPDIAEVSDAFDREFDQTSYEEKIGNLVRNFRAYSREANREDFDAWKEALRTISQEDHYLLVLANPDKFQSSPKTNFLKLATIGFVLACVLFAMAYLFVVRWNVLPNN